MKKSKKTSNWIGIIASIIFLLLLIFFVVNFVELRGGEKPRLNFNILKSDISKQEAEHTTYNFARGLTDEPVKVMNSYKEGGYWKVMVSIDNEPGILEINAKTGKVEYLVSDGERYSVDEILR